MTHDESQAFSGQVFAARALDEETTQLPAVAVAHITQCHVLDPRRCRTPSSEQARRRRRRDVIDPDAVGGVRALHESLRA